LRSCSASHSRPGSALYGAQPGSALHPSRSGSALNTLRPGSALNALRPGSALNASRPGSALNASRPGSALYASRPGSRASSRSARFDPALFYSSMPPTHHSLASSSNIAQARRVDNSRRGHVVLFVLGGPSSGKTALSAALAAAIPGVEHLQVQQLLRREALAGTELGEHIKASFALGQPLAASVTASVLRDAMGSARPERFIVSDFPLTPEHVVAFAETVLPNRFSAIRLHVSTDMARERCRASNEQFLDVAELCLSEETLVRRLVDYEAHIEPVVRSLTESSWVQTVEASGAWADVLSKVQQALAAIPGYQ